ncbi:MAG: 50S ribosomal protein L3 [Bacilli bacterium]|nr:50S ribosomal protein L3 [Bacilli bacterium]
MKGILGLKRGMTQVFDQDGKLTPVTVVEVTPNVVTQIKTKANDGYDAIQLGFDEKREKLANKPSVGHTSKANTTPKRFFKEIRGVNIEDYALGQEIKADIFTRGEVIDVTGTTKGKGFQGVIKRHGQQRGPMGHGSHYHRRPGSMGTMRPMRVFKGKKLPGHMGTNVVTIQNLEVIMVDVENNVILVKGNIPGPKNGLVLIRSAVKHPNKINERPELISWTVEEVETPETAVEENIEPKEEVTEVTEETTEEKKETSEEVVAEETEEPKEETPKKEEE